MGLHKLRLQLPRTDQARREKGETWRPIPCVELSPLRRFFDLQAGTVWADLSCLLPKLSGTLVDVGCGAQPYRRLLAKDVTYIGIDTTEAKTAFGYETPDTLYYDGRAWPLGDASVDVVLATETLEHVVTPREFIGEALRTLRPGGQLVLTVPFAARWHFIPFDYWRFTPAGLNRLLTDGGFVDARVYARGNALTVAAYKCIAVLAVFILPQSSSRLRAAAYRLLGIALLPMFVASAVVGNLSLRARGGDDCLGYTAIATKPAQ